MIPVWGPISGGYEIDLPFAAQDLGPNSGSGYYFFNNATIGVGAGASGMFTYTGNLLESPLFKYVFEGNRGQINNLLERATREFGDSDNLRQLQQRLTDQYYSVLANDIISNLSSTERALLQGLDDADAAAGAAMRESMMTYPFDYTAAGPNFLMLGPGTPSGVEGITLYNGPDLFGPSYAPPALQTSPEQINPYYPFLDLGVYEQLKTIGTDSSWAWNSGVELTNPDVWSDGAWMATDITRVGWQFGTEPGGGGFAAESNRSYILNQTSNVSFND